MSFTFWKLLKNNDIEIPVFQRDYAQGRHDMAALRHDFLCQIFSAIDAGTGGDMDFVYSFLGNSGALQPLDGQQRLTTLWLVHWYVAIHALKDDALRQALEVLGRFSYRTRRSSACFIQALCDYANAESLAKGPAIAQAIRQRTWMASAWLQDPTVEGMLRTLEGTPDDKGLNNNGIEPLLAGRMGEMDQMWRVLSADDCPLRFDHIAIADYEITAPDLLYVKMNARGKQLTPFEKFKAQWIGLMRKDDQQLYEKYSLLLDTNWSDAFWNPAYNTTGSDGRKMAFFTRFFFTRLILAQRANTQHRNDICLASPLYGREATTGYRFCFDSLNDFASLLSFGNCQALERIFTNLKALGGEAAVNAMVPGFFGDFAFLSSLRNDDKGNCPANDAGYPIVANMTMKHQALFFAICLYLEHCAAPKPQALRQWIRVCANIIENTNPESTMADHLAVLFRIADIAAAPLAGGARGCDYIYGYLLQNISAIARERDTRLQRRLREEAEKAARIFACPADEAAIIKAERSAFFSGAISFLYHDHRGLIDWDRFGRKLLNAREIFDSKGIAGGIDEQAARIARFIGAFDTATEFNTFAGEFFLSPSADNWKKILLTRRLARPISQWLLHPTRAMATITSPRFLAAPGRSFAEVDHNPFEIKRAAAIQRMLRDGLVIAHVLRHVPGNKQAQIRRDLICYYYYSDGSKAVVPLLDRRARLIRRLGLIAPGAFACTTPIAHTPYFYGKTLRLRSAADPSRVWVWEWSDTLSLESAGDANPAAGTPSPIPAASRLTPAALLSLLIPS